MDLSGFTANYAQLGDDELLCLWADRENLIPEATTALDNELRRRGLNKQNATRVKKRLEVLAVREKQGPLVDQVARAKYERNMKHFVGWEEPEFYSRYRGRDIRKTFAYIRHSFRVWKAFRDHTGHWPVFSICFYFLSWAVVFVFTIATFTWVEQRKWANWVIWVAAIVFVLVVLSTRDMGARLMRKVDWKRLGGVARPRYAV